MSYNYDREIKDQIVTDALMKTLRRFKIIKPTLLQQMFDSMASSYAASTFGTPNSLLMSPTVFNGLLGELKKNDK